MLKLTTTSYLHLFNTLNFSIFVHKSRSNARGIQLVVYYFSGHYGPISLLLTFCHANKTIRLAINWFVSKIWSF